MQISLSTIGKQDVLGCKNLSVVHIVEKNIYALNDFNETKKRKRSSYKRGPKRSMMVAFTLMILLVSLLNVTLAVLHPSPFYVNKLQQYKVSNVYHPESLPSEDQDREAAEQTRGDNISPNKITLTRAENFEQKMREEKAAEQTQGDNIRDILDQADKTMREKSETSPQRTKEEKKFDYRHGFLPVDVLLRKQMYKPRKHSEVKKKLSMLNYIYGGHVLDILGMHRRILKRKGPHTPHRNPLTLMFPILRSRLAHKRMATPNLKNRHSTPSKNKKMTFKDLVCAQKRMFEDANLNMESYCAETEKKSHPFKQARSRRRVFRYHRL